MIYRLHPDAALEHEEQVTFYESRASGLGQRYHTAFCSAILKVCDSPKRYKIVSAPDIRFTAIRGFPYRIIFREAGNIIQVLAIAHHRRRPGYWSDRA